MFTPNRRQTIFRGAWLIATIASLLCFSMVLAASGGLDTSFHGNGKLKMGIVSGQSTFAEAVAIQPDGKIVAVGTTFASATDRNIAIARFTTKGALDTTFNSTGKKVTDLGGMNQAHGVVIDKSTGKIVVAGQKCNTDGSNCATVVLRYNSNGSLDTSFHGSGYRIDNYAYGSFGAVALQSDGKILVGGAMDNTVTKNTDFAIYRFTSAGGLDTSFNGTGKKSIPFASGWNDLIYALAIQPSDGKIIVAGQTCNSSFSNCNLALARLNPDGSLDTSFNTTGKQTTNLGGVDIAWGVALQANGKIVLAGQTGNPTISNFALARYNTNGILDTSFAGTGKKVFDFSGSGKSNWAYSVRVQPTNGKIVACGYSNGDLALARLTSTGALDTTFNHTGKVSIDFGGADACKGLAIQPADGKYVLAGWTRNGSMYSWSLARVLP